MRLDKDVFIEIYRLVAGRASADHAIGGMPDTRDAEAICPKGESVPLGLITLPTEEMEYG